MDKRFFVFFYLASLLISINYGSSFLFHQYIEALHGSEFDMASLLLFTGFGAILSVIFLNQLLLRWIAPCVVINIGVLAYGMGLIYLGSLNSLAYISMIGFFMGLGWGLIYTSSVIALASSVTVENKKNHFSYLAAINALGAGIAPVLCQSIIQHGINLQQIYFFEGSISCLAIIILFFFAHLNTSNEKHQRVKKKVFFFLPNIRSTYAILLGFLGACIFTTLMYFQTTFAEFNQVNYAVFFSVTTITIILSRFLFIRFVSHHNRTLLYLSFVMLFSIFLLLFVKSNTFFYMTSAILFGFSYGLIYPLLQVLSLQEVSVTAHDSIITYFILAYFIGIFGFPIIDAMILAYLNHTVVINALIILSAFYVLLTAQMLRLNTTSYREPA